MLGGLEHARAIGRCTAAADQAKELIADHRTGRGRGGGPEGEGQCVGAASGRFTERPGDP
jgi:hypothetical protein